MRRSATLLILLAALFYGCAPSVMVASTIRGGGAALSNGSFYSRHGSVYALKGFGLLYSHTLEPLMINPNATKVSEGNGSSGSVMDLQLQAVRVTWSDNAIGEIAKKAGIKTVYYADLEELRILGIWATHTVHIYGSANEGTIHLEVPYGKELQAPVPRHPLVN